MHLTQLGLRPGIRDMNKRVERLWHSEHTRAYV